jgi:V/A-type H+-transporting ATPase subunit D
MGREQTMADDPPTRSAALALAEERDVMRQGYEFLDEKRTLLASEILRRLRLYEDEKRTFLATLQTAREALAQAVGRHGLENLQVYPPTEQATRPKQQARSLFLGVPLIELGIETADGSPAFPPLDPSQEAEDCRQAFRKLLGHLAAMAAQSGNLRRLAGEYRRTQKRAQALENVLLPEIRERLKQINEHLETFDLEEAIRARTVGR